MKKLKELVKNSELNTQELPKEYLERAKSLIDEREKKEQELRKSLPPKSGRDDRLNGTLYQLDIQLRKDISDLRKEYNLD